MPKNCGLRWQASPSGDWIRLWHNARIIFRIYTGKPASNQDIGREIKNAVAENDPLYSIKSLLHDHK